MTRLRGGERGSQAANFTAGVREREDANRTREAGDSVLVKTEGAGRWEHGDWFSVIGYPLSDFGCPMFEVRCQISSKHLNFSTPQPSLSDVRFRILVFSLQPSAFSLQPSAFSLQRSFN